MTNEITCRESVSSRAASAEATDGSTSTRRYRCNNFTRLMVGNRQELIYSWSDSSAKILSTEIADLLDHCRTFKTLEEHSQEYYRSIISHNDPLESAISDLSNKMPARVVAFLSYFRQLMRNPENYLQSDHAKIKFIQNHLLDLAAAGFLVSDVDLLDTCLKSASPEDTPGITSVGVLTRNRIDSLERCMVSYIENTKRYERKNNFVVMDDSQIAESRDISRQMLSSLGARYDVEIWYAGMEEKKRFALLLANSGNIPHDVVDFALFGVSNCGITCGANRNALTLHTIGDMIFSIDDDTICQIAYPQELSQRLAFYSGIEPINVWFFPDLDTALREVNLSDCDILAAHEQLLGKTLGNCVLTFGGCADLVFKQRESKLIHGLQSGGIVPVTYNGIVGHSGTSSFGYLLLDDDSRERLLRSEETYRTAITSRQIFRGTSRPCITDTKWCMTTALGYDNRVLMPPFIPIQRAEDTIFGIMSQTCFMDYYFGHVPQALIHAPIDDRSYPLPDTWKQMLTNYYLVDIVVSVVSMKSWPDKVGGREKLQSLGQHFIELGSMTLTDFEECIRFQLTRFESNKIYLLENALLKYGQTPEFWVKDVKDCIGLLRQKILRGDMFIPHELLCGRSKDEARILTKELILQFGRLLYWWPEIVETARDLRARGHRLAARMPRPI
jgi:hypothetical protein